MKHYLLAAAVALTLPCLAAGPGSGIAARGTGNGSNLFPYAAKVKAAEQRATTIGSSKLAKEGASNISVASKLRSLDIPTGDDCGYLDGPDGSVWYFTANYRTEGANLTGFDIIVYDDKFQEVGKVKDNIRMEENETRVAQVSISGQITKKFFNTDNNCEIMIGMAFNTPQYVNHYRTGVYAITPDLTSDAEPLMTIPGYYISAIDTATDRWSEKYWITFYEEDDTQTPMVGEVPNASDEVFRIYKYAAYSGFEAPLMEVRVPTICMPGENAVPLIANVKDGKPYFAVNYMKYCWFENPFDYNNENPTANNELIIDLYTTNDSWTPSIEKYSTTRIPSHASVDDRYFLYLGAFSYSNDLSLGVYSNNNDPYYIITQEHYRTASDDYNYTFDLYRAAEQGADAEAQYQFNLADKVEQGIFLSDLRGYDPQVMFVKTNGTDFFYNFTNLLTGEIEHTLPVYITEDMSVTLSANTDRVLGGDSYLYVSAATHGYGDEDNNVWQDIAYITPEGEVDHIDSLNLGKDVDLAQVYIAPDAFDPFLFNLDDNQEYMLLVKRRNASGLGNSEELLIVSADKEIGTLATIKNDEEHGDMRSIFLLNTEGERPALAIIFEKDDQYNTVIYDLPLTLFSQGEGTVENPYVVSTVGELAHIGNFPEAHYVLNNDIDATNYLLKQKEFTFSGSLDGCGHYIKNLEIEGRAVIPELAGTEGNENKGVVRNLSFVNPKYNANVSSTGLVVGAARNGLIENVHIYDGEILGTQSVSGIIGDLYLNSRLEGCSVNNTTVQSAEMGGGLAVRSRTGSTISSCAFSGSLTGNDEVGGIIGAIESNAGPVKNCHVNAAIKAKNTLGGIAGSNGPRAAITNCYVQGSIEATEATRWIGGPKAGGIVGDLGIFVPSEDGSVTETPIIISGNFVNLSSISYSGTTFENEWPGQNDTMHRIVGRTSYNYETEEIGYNDETYRPIYSQDPNEPDAGVANNYAIDTLPVCDANIGADLNSTEGQSVSTDALGMEFFMDLGFAYGNEIDAPWDYTGNPRSPRLFFETGLLICSPDNLTMLIEEEKTITLTLAGAELTEELMESFSFESTDETIADVTPEAGDNAILINVKGLKEGVTTLRFNLGNTSAEARVEVKKLSGVNDAIVDNAAGIRFDGRTITADGCAITIYNTSGATLLTGRDTLDAGTLPGGIYIVNAIAADGSRRSLKIRLR